MECIEARALKKSSFLSEFASQQSLFDDFFYVNGVINSVTNDDFSVDVFLNLSNGDFDGELAESEEEEKESLSTSYQEREEKFSGPGQPEPLPADDFSFPVEDLENLEWLSQFVDDSASESSLLCPAGNYIPKTETTNSLYRFKPPVHPHTPVLCFPSTVPAKARTKRRRTGGQSWSGGSPESSGESSLTSTLIFSNRAWDVRAGFENSDGSEEVVKPPPAKRGRKRLETADGSGDVPLSVQRWCSHCQVQKTPQWRNGPLGPKTLCNACGVRFKSGRLFPEYRPACSPTFSGDVHSNSHRKVLEMRKKKEVTVTGDESGVVM